MRNTFFEATKWNIIFDYKTDTGRSFKLIALYLFFPNPNALYTGLLISYTN